MYVVSRTWSAHIAHLSKTALTKARWLAILRRHVIAGGCGVVWCGVVKCGVLRSQDGRRLWCGRDVRTRRARRSVVKTIAADAVVDDAEDLPVEQQHGDTWHVERTHR